MAAEAMARAADRTLRARVPPAANLLAHPSMSIADLPPLVQVTVSAEPRLGPSACDPALGGVAAVRACAVASLTRAIAHRHPGRRSALLWQLSGLFSPETGTMLFRSPSRNARGLFAAAVMMGARPEIERNCIMNIARPLVAALLSLGFADSAEAACQGDRSRRFRPSPDRCDDGRQRGGGTAVFDTGAMGAMDDPGSAESLGPGE